MTEALQDGISVNGYVDNNQWNYYYADTQTSNNMVIKITQVGSGDCDVYIKANENPTKTSFDLKDIGFSTSFNLTVLNPLGSVWHIGVYGYRTCNYDITEIISKNSCPNNCSGNGQCSNSGRCSCSSGFAGNDCGSRLFFLSFLYFYLYYFIYLLIFIIKILLQVFLIDIKKNK